MAAKRRKVMGLEQGQQTPPNEPIPVSPGQDAVINTESNEEVTITAVRKPHPVQQFLVRFEPFWPDSSIRIGAIPPAVTKELLMEYLSVTLKSEVLNSTEMVGDTDSAAEGLQCIIMKMATKEQAAKLVRLGNRKELKVTVKEVPMGPFSVRCSPSFKTPYKWEFWFRATERMENIQRESVLEKLRKKTTVKSVKLHSDIGAEKALPVNGALSDIISAVFDKAKYNAFVASQQSALATFHARYSSQGNVVSNGATALLYHDKIPYSANSVAKPFVFYYKVT